MISQPTILGIYIGLAFGIIYLILAVITKQIPDFNKFATIVLSCVGAVVGMDFGYIALSSKEAGLGALAGQRLPMVLGAGAVIWLAVEQGMKVYHPLLIKLLKTSRADLES